MQFRILKLAAVICAGLLSTAIYAATHAEYQAYREKTSISTLPVDENVTDQFPALAGQIVEIEGQVTGIFSGEKGYGYLLSQPSAKPLIIFSQVNDPYIAVGNALRVLARVPAKGAVLESVIVTINGQEATVEKYESLGNLPDDEDAASFQQPSVTRYYRAPELIPQPAEHKSPAVNQAPPSMQTIVNSYASRIREINGSLDADTAITIASCLLKESGEHGVDPRLVFAMITQESRFNPKAVSRSGAMGLGQLMPRTAAGLGVSDSFDIGENMCGTVRYISYQLNRFGHVSLALAAYNAGPGAVNKYGGIPPYNETQNYVSRIWNMYAQLSGVDPRTGEDVTSD